MAGESGFQPGLSIIHANHPEDLRQLVTQVIQRTPLRPLENEVFLVQSNGMAQWLKLNLAQDDALGIAAAMDMQMPARFLWSAYRSVLGNAAVPAASPFDKEPLTWRLMRILPQCLDDASFTPLRHFLADDDDCRKRYQLSERLADLYDQYQVYRADWLAAWESGRDERLDARGGAYPLAPDQRWQASLWRCIHDDIDAPDDRSRAAIHQAFLTAIAGLRQRPPGLPRRLLVFGISSLPQQMLEALDAMARLMTIQVYVHNPCQYYWADIIEERQLLRFDHHRHAAKAALAGIDGASLHLKTNPLLAAWGKQGRDYIGLLYHYDQERISSQQIDLFRDRLDPARPRLLHQLQQRILTLDPTPGTAPEQDETPYFPVAPDDDSLTFHLAHSRQREVEVLHDCLLDLLQRGEGDLQPRDIIVMVPDISLYAPHMEAVFGHLERNDPRYIPYSIADRAERTSNPLLMALEKLLGLSESRFAVSDILDLLDVAAFRDSFGLRAEDLPRLHHWIEDSGIRWGLHAGHRAALDLPEGLEQNSWRFGLRRMLLGYACGNPGPWRDIEPYDELGGLDAATAGRLAQVLETLEHFWSRCRQPHSPHDWADTLRELIETCLTPSDGHDALLLDRFADVVSQWQTDCGNARLTEELPLAVVRDALLSRFDDQSLSQRFLAGMVNMGTLMPMRAIPFRVVCLLGMNDGDYPRQRPPMDFDLMAEDYRPGDRSRREDDRYLFLEALLSARDHLHISYIGRSERDNAPRAPSVLVGQLQDHIAAGWRLSEPVLDARGKAQTLLGHLTRQYPLQPFSRQYFVQMPKREIQTPEGGAPASDARLFTYAREWASVHQPQREAAPEAGAVALPPHLLEQPLTLGDLSHLLREPVQYFYERRLGVFFDSDASTAEDAEHFALDHLAQYQIRDRLIAAARAEDNPEIALERIGAGLARSGRLPLPPESGLTLATLTDASRETLDQMRETLARFPHPRDALELAYEIEIPGQAMPLRLEDWVHGLYTDGNGATALVQLRPNRFNGNKYHYWLPLWAPHLALCAVGEPVTTVLVCEDGAQDLAPLPQAEARKLLDQLLAAAWQALQEPLPLSRELAFAAWLPSLLPLHYKNAKKCRDALAVPETTRLAQAAEACLALYEAGQGRRGGPAAAAIRERQPYLAHAWPEWNPMAAQFGPWCDRLYRPLWLALHGEVPA